MDKGEGRKFCRHVLPSLGELECRPPLKGRVGAKGGRQEALYLRLVHRGTVAAIAFALRLACAILAASSGGTLVDDQRRATAWRARGPRRRERRRERDR